MPHLIPIGSQFILMPERQPQAHINHIAKTLGELSSGDDYTDVVIHCKDSKRVLANSVVLSQASTMLRNVFNLSCDCFGFVNFRFDLLCPDFSSRTVTNLLEVLKTGSVMLDSKTCMTELSNIMHHFKISITLKHDYLVPSANPQGTSLVSETVRYSTAYEDMRQLRPSLSSYQPASRPIEPNTSLESDSDDLMEVTYETTTVTTSRPVGTSSTTLRCEPCDISFNFRQAYDRHVRKNHSMDTQDSSVKLERSEDDDIGVNVSVETINDSGNASADLSDIAEVEDDSPLKPQSPVKAKLKKPSRRSRKKSDKDDADWVNESTSSTNGKTFQCPCCEVKTTSKASHLSHVLFVHYRDRLRAEMGSRDGFCKICKRMLKGERSLGYHLYSVHGLFTKELGFTQDTSVEDTQATTDRSEGDSEPVQTRNSAKRSRAENQDRSSDDRSESDGSSDDMIFRCVHCDLKTNSKAKMLRHVAGVFRKKLLKKYSTSTENECRKCKAILKDESSLVDHLIYEHKYGDRYVVEKSRGDAEDADEDVDANVNKPPTTSSSSSSSDSGNHKGQPEPQREEESGDDKTCRSCSRNFSSTTDLLFHMSETHAKDEMSSFYGNEVGECRLCAKIMLDEACLRQHLVIKHSDIVSQVLLKSNKHPEKDTLDAPPSDTRSQAAADPEPGSTDNSFSSADESPEFKVPPTPAPKRRGRPPKTPRPSLAEPDIPVSPRPSSIPVTPMKGRKTTGPSGSGQMDFTPAKRARLTANHTESVRKNEAQVARTPAKVENLFRCNKCDLQTRDYSNLICHIGQLHFREKLQRLQGDSDFECGFCRDVLASDVQFILHMADQHRAIELPSKESLRVSL